jgi:RND family efflux transporter, MFP subunit
MKKLSKKKKAIIMFAVVAVIGVIAYVLAQSSFDTSSGPSVEVSEVTKQNITSSISTSGDVGSLTTKAYFSPVNATIKTFEPEVGEVVKAGTLLVAFDTAMLERDNQKADLNESSIANGNQASLDQVSQSNASITNAKSKANSLSGDIRNLEGSINSLTQRVNEKSTTLQTNRAAEVNAEIARLNELLTQVTTAISQLDPVADVTAINELETNRERYETEINNLQQSVATASDAELVNLQAQLESLHAQLATANAEYQAARGAADSAVPATVSKAARAQMSDTLHLAELESSTIEELLQRGRDGITAEFDGIIASVSTVEGSSATQGMPLFEIADNKNVVVDVTISRHDYDKIQIGQKATIDLSNKTYTGSVHRISRIAQVNETGAQVIHASVKINNPDDDIFLGVEAKVQIQLGEKKDALVVNRAAINTNSEGDFVYVIRNGKVETVTVQTGYSSSELIQIESGLSLGDQVIIELPDGIDVGSAVTAKVSEDASTSDADKE